MSELIVITFGNVDDAAKARQALKEAEHSGYVKLDDSEVVVKDEAGKVHLHGQTDTGVKVGALGGGLLGLLIAGIFFPVAGLVIGALGGALVGKLAGLGVDKKFVNDVSDSLQPGTSALFLILAGGTDPGPVIAALRPFEGSIYQTTLPSDAVDGLREALKAGN